MSFNRSDVARAEVGRQRIKAVRRQLEERDLDVLLAFGSGRHHVSDANLAWWLSGVRQLGRDAVVALPRNGAPVLLIGPSWDGPRACRRGWIDDVVAVDDVVSALVTLVRERGWRGLRAAGAGCSSASPAMAAALQAAFMRMPVDDDDVVLAVASTHDSWALACIERAAEIAHAGYRHMCEVARTGMKEYELAAECDGHMRELGADDNFLLMAASSHNNSLRVPTDRPLSEGDVLLAEISPSVDGHFAQICRSAVIGEPDDRQLACYETLREGYQAGLDRAGPDVAVRDVARAIDAAITARGYGEYCRPPYMRARGHGLGLGVVMPAVISEQSDVVLEAGMSFVLHPNQYLPELGYLVCGDQVVITGDGRRALSPSPSPPALDAIAGVGAP